jgi:hypothetical protein
MMLNKYWEAYWPKNLKEKTKKEIKGSFRYNGAKMHPEMEKFTKIKIYI